LVDVYVDVFALARCDTAELLDELVLFDLRTGKFGDGGEVLGSAFEITRLPFDPFRHTYSWSDATECRL